VPVLTADQRIEYVQAIWAQFCEVHKVHRDCARSDEYELARKWAVRGIPLATVLQGINQTTGKPRTLMACERSVEEQISRWHKAVSGLKVLPESGELEYEPFDVEEARRRRDEGLVKMRGER
jgi:hypothetical protein